MANDQQPQDQKAAEAAHTPETSQTSQKPGDNASPNEFDGLKGKKPEELTPDELRLMADTMPGEGPGD